MEGYPLHYIAHNVPLVALCGLGTPDPNAFDELEQDYAIIQNGGQQITSELSDVTGPKAEDLLDCFRNFDAQDAAWNNRPGRGKVGSMGFTYRTFGRSITFPRQKAPWPDLEGVPEANTGSRRPSVILHSPLSPLTPSSPLNPDGIMTPLWFAKHQLLLPAVLLVFFNFTSDQSRTVMEDNRLKAEINSLKAGVSNTGYKTRLAFLLVAEVDDIDPRAAERVANLRRATGLDSKSLFYLPGYASQPELRAFVGNILAALQPACIEYYRDLSKHARRKRSRNSTSVSSIDPSTNTLQSLPAQGWMVRYETKLGSFAEFRQEMDAAGRSYESAYESLIDSEIFEATSYESLRFNENRLLADVLAIRIIRCLLWTGQTTSAVQSWTNHKTRIRDIMERKGIGTYQQSWEAWEAKWSTVMGEIIEKVDLPIFQLPSEIRSPVAGVPDIPRVLSLPEKSFGSDPRLAPWDFLHHSGYWFAQAAYHMRTCRELAQLNPPEEDKYDYSTAIVNSMTLAADHFSTHGGLRATEKAYLELALEHVKAERWVEAMEVLRPLWQTLTWRSSGWWDLVFQASRAMKICSREMRDWETYLAAEWELMSNCLPCTNEDVYDFKGCLDGYSPSPKPFAKLDFANLAPTFIASFTFSKTKGNAGVPESAQLTLTSCAHIKSSPITISSAELSFEGLKEVYFFHDADSMPSLKVSESITYYEGDPLASGGNESSPEALRASGAKGQNLEFEPGHTKIFSFKILPREAGEARATSILLKIREAAFYFDIKIPLRERSPAPPWWHVIDDRFNRRKLGLEKYCSLTVLPKPPKLRISLPRFPKTFYVDEIAEVAIDLCNEEDNTANVKLFVTLTGDKGPIPRLQSDQYLDKTEPNNEQKDLISEVELEFGEVTPQKRTQRIIFFQARPATGDLNLLIRADYFLTADPETPITLSTRESIQILAPFDASYEFIPRVRSDPWPSYFVVDESSSSDLKGLPQSWHAKVRATSAADETLQVHDVRLEASDVKFISKCSIKPIRTPENDVQVAPAHHVDRIFHIEAQKAELEDRRSGHVSTLLKIDWCRPEEPSKLTTTSLLVPTLTVPFGEPRVLCAAKAVLDDPYMVHLSYMLENPSTHFLNFSVTMETSDEFAFSGPKAQVLQLVPLSRCEIRYNLIPFSQNTWIHPYLRVTDTGFGQELKIHASEGCRSEKKAIAIWVAEISSISIDST